MSRPHSQLALQSLEQLQAQPDRPVTLSFKERASLFTAEWAVRRFAAQILVDKVMDTYNQQPEYDSAGRPIDPQDVGGVTGDRLRSGQEVACIDGLDIAEDLRAANKRLNRGYQLSQITMHGVHDTSTIVACLEKAVEINPENLTSGEDHFQAAAKRMLDDMQIFDAEIGNSTGYLL